MPHSLLAKYLTTALVLALAIICVVSLALYSNYAQLSNELVSSGVDQNDAILKSRLEERAVMLMRSIEREIDAYAGREDIETVERLRADAVEEETELTSLSVELAANGERLGEPFVENYSREKVTVNWQEDALTIAEPVIYRSELAGLVIGRFDLASLQQELADFQEELREIESRYRYRGAVWVASATFGMLIGCAVLAWLAASRLVAPITDLTRQANNIASGNYGESLPETRRDELGELAQAFNQMKDQLRQTTISLDYLDSVLSSMNDAVIVTGPDGSITRINSAATSMLDYPEEQLLGLPVSTIVAEEHRETFAAAPLGARPRETVFETRHGEKIPVSWTGSVIETDNPLFQGHIYTAQNIRERKRAEQRIRYLARIDALTKVPNRMQFQHLLQRGIARARRERHCLALLYVDVDQFKDINDTFGHLAGDAALETLTQRLTSRTARQQRRRSAGWRRICRDSRLPAVPSRNAGPGRERREYCA